MSLETRPVIRQFFATKFPDLSLADDQDIFSLGFFSSLMAMELVMYVEQQFAVRIPNDQLNIENFRSIDIITNLVEKLRGETENSVQ